MLHILEILLRPYFNVNWRIELKSQVEHFKEDLQIMLDYKNVLLLEKSQDCKHVNRNTGHSIA